MLVLEGIEEYLWFTDEFGSYSTGDERYIFNFTDFVVNKLEGYVFESSYNLNLTSNEYYFFGLSSEYTDGSISFLTIDKMGEVHGEFRMLNRLGYPIILDTDGNMVFGKRSSSAGVSYNRY